MMTLAQSTAERYDRALHYARRTDFSPNQAVPQPTTAWPAENIALLERYQNWLLGSGVSPYVTEIIHIPMAGHVLGLALKPHSRLDLTSDLNRTMDYIRAKKMSDPWTKNCRNSLLKFRQFLRQERGLPDLPPFGAHPLDLTRYQTGLPDWLLTHLSQYQRLQQAHWRPARLTQKIKEFWSVHTRLFHWLLTHHPFDRPLDLKRHHIMDYLDYRLATGVAVSTINCELRAFIAVLGYLQEQEYEVPKTILRMPGLKLPDRLPRFLTDEQVIRLRDDLESQVELAITGPARRDAGLIRAAFYLLWQGGLRLGEVEDLLLADLDLVGRRLTVRQGKGGQDRTVYLTDRAVAALNTYLAGRGAGASTHLFLYRARSLGKDLIRDRLAAAGERTGVPVSPHRLRHTFATQLLNAGCRVTSIQKLLGHRRLNSTMIYARVHNHTVAEDYYTAMAKIEQRLNPAPDADPPASAQVWSLLERLQAEPLTESQQAAVQNLRLLIITLAEPTATGIPMNLPIAVA